MPYTIRRSLTDTERAKLVSVPDVSAHLLFHRGITNDKSAQKFLNPDYEGDTHDPFLLKDSEKAARRIIQAIKNKERIAIYADYDADGIPGAAIFNDLFKRIDYENYSIYIPHRHDEGFGMNKEAVEQLAGEGVNLIITVDCGITDVVPAGRAKELGMDVIITDHHEPPTPLPEVFAIVDHKQTDCNYPDKNLCGSGVAFKLIQAILKIERFGLKEGHEKWLLDLVGMATLSDMVSLTGENRVFAHFGLAVLRKSPRKGIMQLLRRLNIDQRYLNEDDIAFMITPRINAASRMGLPMDAFKLLAADNETDADFYAKHLDAINNERKGVVASLVKEVKKILHERYGVGRRKELEINEEGVKEGLNGIGGEEAEKDLGGMKNGLIVKAEDPLPRVIVMGNPMWRPSLLGLVANTCAEEFNRPAFFWGRDGDDIIKGSCRSEGKTNVVELMRAVPAETFIQFGGHHHSGGFAVSNDDIHFLEQRLNKAAEEMGRLKKKSRASGGTIEKGVGGESVGGIKNGVESSLEGSGTIKSGVGSNNGKADSIKNSVGGDVKGGDISKDAMSNVSVIEGDFEIFGGLDEGNETSLKVIDCELSLDAINSSLHNEINRLAPFGVGNPKPVFLFRNVVPYSVRTFGKTNDHVEIIFKKSNGDKIPAIAFFGAKEKWASKVKAGKVIDLIASLEKSMYGGRSELRLRVVEVITDVRHL